MTTGLRLALMASPTTLGLTAGAMALAPMRAEMGFAATDGSVLVAYTVGVAVGTPLAGRIERIIGGRKALWMSVVMVILGALLTAIGQSETAVLVGRTALGLGSGGFTTMAFIGASRHLQPVRAFATISAVMNAVAGAGALVGAIASTEVSWRLTLVLPALAVLAAPSALRDEKKIARSSEAVRWDSAGVVLVTVTVTAALMALDAPSAGLAPLTAGAAALVALSAGALLAWWSRGIGAQGFVPVRALASREYRRALTTGPFFMAANFSTLFLVPVLLIQHGADAFSLGLMALPASAVAVAAGAYAVRAHRVGRAHIAMAGAGASVALVSGAAALDRSEIVLAVAVSVALGATALAQGLLSSTATRSIRPEDRSDALGMFNLTLQVGGAAGVAVVAGVAAWSSTLALLTCGAFGLAGGVLGLLWHRPESATPHDTPPPDDDASSASTRTRELSTPGPTAPLRVKRGRRKE